jgi:hypothetical protein
MITLMFFSYFVLAPLSVTVLYKTNFFGMQDLSRYYLTGHLLYNSLPFVFLGAVIAQTFVGCFSLVSHFCPSFFIFKPWAYHWADLASLLLTDSIFGNLFIDVEGRYDNGDLILYDKTKIFRHQRILHTFDGTHLYALKAINKSTGFFILDLTKPKSLILYELVKNTEFLIEPFRFTNDAIVTYIPNGFRAVEGLVYIPDVEGKFQLLSECDNLNNLILSGNFFCHKNIVYQLVEDRHDLSTWYFNIVDPDSHRPRSWVCSYTAIPREICTNSVTAWNKCLALNESKLIGFKSTGSELYRSGFYLYRIR